MSPRTRYHRRIVIATKSYRIVGVMWGRRYDRTASTYTIEKTDGHDAMHVQRWKVCDPADYRSALEGIAYAIEKRRARK